MKSPEVSLTGSLPFGCTTTGAPIVLEMAPDEDEDADEDEGGSRSSTGCALWSSICAKERTVDVLRMTRFGSRRQGTSPGQRRLDIAIDIGVEEAT